MLENNPLQDKINNVGSDMIMSAAMSHTDEENEALQNLVEANEANKQQNTEAAIVGNASIDDLAKAYMMRPRHLKPIKREHDIRRNDPCPCGSGKKYKNCCLASGKYETYVR